MVAHILIMEHVYVSIWRYDDTKKSIISIGKATYTLVKFNCNLPKAASEANNVWEQFIEVKTEGKETIIVFLKKESFLLRKGILKERTKFR